MKNPSHWSQRRYLESSNVQLPIACKEIKWVHYRSRKQFVIANTCWKKKLNYSYKHFSEVSDSFETWSTLLIQGDMGCVGNYPHFEKWRRGKSIFLLHNYFGKHLRRNWIFSMEAKQYCPLDQAVEIFCFAWQFWKLAPPHTDIFSYWWYRWYQAYDK